MVKNSRQYKLAATFTAELQLWRGASAAWQPLPKLWLKQNWRANGRGGKIWRNRAVALVCLNIGIISDSISANGERFMRFGWHHAAYRHDDIMANGAQRQMTRA